MVAQNKLDSFIPRPETKQAKRHMISLNEADYNAVTKLAHENGTTRGRIITALLANYNDK